MTTLEPGGMRTEFGAAARKTLSEIWPEYEQSVGVGLKQLQQVWGHESGDPAKVARIILKLAEAARLPPRIVLGSDVLPLALQAGRARLESDERWSAVSRSIDFKAEGAIPELPSN